MSTLQIQPMHHEQAYRVTNQWRWLCAGLIGIGLGLVALATATLGVEVWAVATLLLLFLAVALMIGQLQKLLLAVIILEIPIQIDKSYLYNEEAASFSALGGFNISLTTLCLFALYALWLAELLAMPQPEQGSPKPVSVSKAPFLYVTIVALSIFVASDAMLALFEVNLLVQALLIFIYVAFRVRTPQDVRYVMLVLMIGLFLQCILMGILAITRESFAIGTVTARIDFGTRVGGTVGSPNSTASYFTLLLASLLGFSCTPVSRPLRRASLLIFGLGALAILLTLSRGGLTGFVISMMVFCLVAWRMQWLSIKVPLLLLLFSLIPLWLYGDQLALRLFGDDDGAASARLPLMRLALRMIGDHPILGVGANNFATVWNPYLTPDITFEWIHTVHNKYLLVWTETGILGLCAFLGFLLSTVRRGWRIVQWNDPRYSPLALGLTAGIIGQMVHMNVDLFTGRSQVQMLWLVAGLITAMTRRPMPFRLPSQELNVLIQSPLGQQPL